MNTLKANLGFIFDYAATKNLVGDLRAIPDKQDIGQLLDFTLGAGAGAANQIYCYQRTLAGGASEQLDLYGVLANNLGETINFARVKGWVFWHSTASLASQITIGGTAASNTWRGPFKDNSDALELLTGEFAAWGGNGATGRTVTNASADQVLVTNNDGSHVATYVVGFIGALT